LVSCCENGHKSSQGQPESILRQRIDPDAEDSGIDWSAWLRCYRACLRELRERFGLPGDSFTNSTTSGVQAADSRLLGDLPPARGAAETTG
jgi:hypothetical protein